jgi:hypothetical protein
MGQVKIYVMFAFKVAIALIILNLILGAIEQFANLQVRKYVYAPWITFFGSSTPAATTA